MSDGERNGVAMWGGETWHPTSTSDGVYWLLKEETKQNRASFTSTRPLHWPSRGAGAGGSKNKMQGYLAQKLNLSLQCNSLPSESKNIYKCC